MQYLKQSTAADILLGPFVDSTDFVTLETGLTISQADIRLSKGGAAFAQTNNATGATHRENGHYVIPLNSTDTNTLGSLRVAVHESGALPVWRDFMVVPANVWDSLFGADKLQVDVSEVGGTAQTAGDIIGDTNDIQTRLPAALVGGRMDSNLSAIGNDAQSATDLKDFADAGYDPATNKVEGVKTADALTTNNDKTGYAIGTGGIAAAAFAAGAIDSAAIAADAIGSSELAQSAAQEVADEVLNRNIAGGGSGGARTVRSALRKLRNRLAIATGTLTVYQEDDATPDHTEAVTTAAGDPIVETDPAT